jgi:hypothetical protein
MSHMRLWASAAIIAFVILITFALSVPRVRDIPVESVISPTEKETTVPTVTLHDSFKKGLHTITGSIETPNACTRVLAKASIVGDASSTQNILVEIATQTDSGVCLQIPTRADFQATTSAPANLSITAVINGSDAITTVK